MTPAADDSPEIEIRDPDSVDGSGSRLDTLEPNDGEREGGPYKNLVVPLVVVPAMIVMVAVIIAVLFGLLSGSEATPRENLDTLLEGGVNERQQAAFGLARQLLDVQSARNQGRDPEWGIDESFLGRLRNARDGVAAPTAPADVWVPFVLSALSAELGDEAGVRELVEMTRLDDRLDPETKFRMNAIFILGSIGGELSDPLRDEVARALFERIDGGDEGVALLAAGALQNLPGPETERVLEGLLGSRRIDMRLQAALSLAELGSDAGADVLLEAIDLAPYEAERAAEKNRWAPQTVSPTRIKALEALRVLGRLPDEATLRRLADDDEDPNVRSKALELLESVDASASEPAE